MDLGALQPILLRLFGGHTQESSFGAAPGPGIAIKAERAAVVTKRRRCNGHAFRHLYRIGRSKTKRLAIHDHYLFLTHRYIVVIKLGNRLAVDIDLVILDLYRDL